MKRVQFWLVCLTLLALLLSACAPAATPASSATPIPATATAATSATPAALTFTDGLKRSVTLPAAAQKVVSLSPSNTEILFAVGAGSQVIGRDDFSDYPEAAKAIGSIGGSNGKLNLEAIAQLQPDLVLASEINTADQVKAIEALKLNVYYLQNPNTLDELFTNLETVGKLTGHEKEATDLVAQLQARVKAVDEKIATAASQPKVFYELDATNPAKPYTAGPGTFINTLIQQAGGINIGSAMKSPWAEISQEELLAQNPDLILLGDAAYGTSAEQVAQRPGWETLKAVQDKAIFAFDDNLASRPGPRLVDGLEAFAKAIHPELFK